MKQDIAGCVVTFCVFDLSLDKVITAGYYMSQLPANVNTPVSCSGKFEKFLFLTVT